MTAEELLALARSNGMPMASLPAMVGTSLYYLVSQALQFLVPTYLAARRQPRRERFALRACLCGLAFLALTGATSLPIVLLHGYPWRYVGNFATYSLYLLAMVPLILCCFDTGLWNAAFCITVGYTIQNMGSGMEEVARLGWEHTTGAQPGILATMNMTNLWVAAAIVVSYLAFIRRVDRMGPLDERDHGFLGMVLLVILAVVGFDVIIRGVEREGGGPLGFLLALRLIHMTVCLFVLYTEYELLFNVRLRAEVQAVCQMSAERERQYTLSRQNIEAINIKCHDIRHQIRHLANAAADSATGPSVDPSVLADIAREVDVYDSTVLTGNDALDTILTEKSLVCEREGITLSCIADGQALSFMEPADIYSLFGNALDNAIQAARELDDPTRRSISLTVRRVGELVSVHVENYFSGTRDFADGLPRTTNPDAANHGFGTRSMRMLVERYGGTLTLDAQESPARDEGVFRLNAMLPVPADR